MKYVRLGSLALGAMMAVAMLTVPAKAGPIISNWAVTGLCSGGEACGASATVTETYDTNGTATFEIALTDTEANPKSAGDLLSGFTFSLNDTYSSSVKVSPQSETLITVKSATGPYTEKSAAPTHWGVGITTKDCSGASSCIGLETAGSLAKPHQPIDMIIGLPDSHGNYSNANSSITDGHFSPYILGTGIFFVNVSGLPHNLTLPPEISGVQFAFGTSPDSYLIGRRVPEPSSLPVLLMGLGFIGGALYFGRKKAIAA